MSYCPCLPYFYCPCLLCLNVLVFIGSLSLSSLSYCSCLPCLIVLVYYVLLSLSSLLLSSFLFASSFCLSCLSCLALLFFSAFPFSLQQYEIHRTTQEGTANYPSSITFCLCYDLVGITYIATCFCFFIWVYS